MEHLRKNKFDSFQHLPLDVQADIRNNDKYCLNLFFPAFNIRNGILILQNRRERNNNNDETDLILRPPTVQESLNTPLTSKLMQPRKTKTSTNGGARHPGLGERLGGNTISPSRRHHRGREGA